jgi:hypothetical protein
VGVSSDGRCVGLWPLEKFWWKGKTMKRTEFECDKCNVKTYEPNNWWVILPDPKAAGMVIQHISHGSTVHNPQHACSIECAQGLVKERCEDVLASRVIGKVTGEAREARSNDNSAISEQQEAVQKALQQAVEEVKKNYYLYLPDLDITQGKGK